MIKLKQLSKVCYYLLILNIIAIMCFSYKAETVIISYATFSVSAVAMILHIIFRQEKIVLDKYYAILGLFICWCVASNLWSINIELSIVSTFTMIQLVAYSLILYEFLRYGKIDSNKLIWALGIGTVAMGIYAFAYYEINDFITAILSGQRIGYEINQENTFSIFASMGALAWLGIYFNNPKIKFLLGVLFSTVLIIAGGSRGAFLMWIVCLGWLFIYTRKADKNFINKFFISLLIGLPLLFIVSTHADELSIFKRLEEFFNLFTTTGNVDNSSLLRISMIQYGFKKFLESPIIGYGLNCFRTLLLSYLGFATYSHNNFIEILCDIGLIGFCLYYGIYYMIWKKRKVINPVLFAITLFTFLNGMFDPNYYSKILYIVFAFTLASVDSQNKKTYSHSFERNI